MGIAYAVLSVQSFRLLSQPVWFAAIGFGGVTVLAAYIMNRTCGEWLHQLRDLAAKDKLNFPDDVESSNNPNA